jgi:hypothetical protein
MSDATVAGSPSFPALVQQFFTDYLLAQRAMSPHTVASYWDAMLRLGASVPERLRHFLKRGHRAAARLNRSHALRVRRCRPRTQRSAPRILHS